MRKYLPVFVALLGLAGVGRAGLKFDSELVKVDAAPEKDTVEAVFSFEVTGTEAMDLGEVETSCGCMKADPDKKTYAPGEKGKITAVFKLGSFEGTVNKTLWVNSNDKEKPRHELTLEVTIPKLVEISPEVSTWNVGDEPTARVVKFKVLGERTIHVVAAVCSREKFTAEIKEIKKGKEYDITLKPADTVEPTLGALRIETDCEIPRFKNRLCFFNITRNLKPVPPATTPAPVPAPAAK